MHFDAYGDMRQVVFLNMQAFCGPSSIGRHQRPKEPNEQAQPAKRPYSRIANAAQRSRSPRNAVEGTTTAPGNIGHPDKKRRGRHSALTFAN